MTGLDSKCAMTELNSKYTIKGLEVKQSRSICNNHLLLLTMLEREKAASSSFVLISYPHADPHMHCKHRFLLDEE